MKFAPMLSPLIGKSRRAGALVALTLLAAVAGCATAPEPVRDRPPEQDIDVSRIPDAVPKPEPRSRYGNPSSYVVFDKRYHVLPSSRGYVERGIASWYGQKFHGRRTSSGETYDMYAMTAAHRTLPLPTYVLVTNLENRRRVTLRVNDRGPFHDNRVIDLSYTAAVKLGIVAVGTGMVEVRALDPQAPEPVSHAEAPPSIERIRLYLQVGAYQLRDNAERVMERLRALGADALNLTETWSDGRRLYRVRFGPLVAVSEADRLARAVIEHGLRPPRIVLE